MMTADPGPVPLGEEAFVPVPFEKQAIQATVLAPLSPAAAEERRAGCSP